MSLAVNQALPDLNRRIGRAVAAALKARGATGKEIGGVLGLSKAQVSARLNGHTPFRADELLVIGDYLGVDAGQFLSDAPVFPLRAECAFSLIEGDAHDPPPGQGILPFRAFLAIQR